MLSFDLRALESTAVQVEADLPATDPVWEGAVPAPTGPVRVEGRLSAAGEDRFYFSGHIAGAVKLECRRCLVDVAVDVKEDIHVLFAPKGDETTEDDPDVFIYPPTARELDIRPAVRESWLLSAPTLAQCTPDCKGLCFTCGTDLNAGSCTCAPASSDRRWDELSRNRASDPSQA